MITPTPSSVRPLKPAMRIRPARNLWSFGAVLLALWYAATSQSNAVAYAYFFAVLALALVSVVHNALSLRGISVISIGRSYGYSGRPFSLRVRVVNNGTAPKGGIEVSWRNGIPEQVGMLTAGTRLDLEVACKGLPRGVYPVEFVTLSSVYPFGLFRCTMNVPVEGEVDVYPDPVGNRELPAAQEISEATASGQRRQGDDFAGVRPYRLGESQRHVDWRAVARDQPMQVKQFEGAIGRLVHLDFDETPGPDLESKLSQLSLWIHEAARLDLEYGLSLGSEKFEPEKGEVHQHALLQSLARYPGI